MMAAADATTDLKVGALVFDNDYKHPVVLAKEMATIDVLSGGRVEFGIGAGWMNTDYEQSGIPHDQPGVRIARMDEGLEVIKGLWAEGPYSFKGEHYTITGLDGLPKPVQQPGPPILIGGGGPKVLGIVGRHADIVGINPSIPAGDVGADAARDAAADRVDQKIEWLKDGAGDRFDDIELNALVFVATVTDDPGPVREMIAGALRRRPAELVVDVALRVDRLGRGDRRPAAGRPRALGLQLLRRAGRRGHGAPPPRWSPSSPGRDARRSPTSGPSRIRSVGLHRVAMRFRHPIRTAGGVVEGRRPLLVHVRGRRRRGGLGRVRGRGRPRLLARVGGRLRGRRREPRPRGRRGRRRTTSRRCDSWPMASAAVECAVLDALVPTGRRVARIVARRHERPGRGHPHGRASTSRSTSRPRRRTGTSS